MNVNFGDEKHRPILYYAFQFEGKKRGGKKPPSSHFSVLGDEKLLFLERRYSEINV